MVEKDVIFKNRMKKRGNFTFKDYYQFCFDWITEEMDMDLAEKKYSEKIKETGKEIEVIWECEKKLTDYFRFDMEVRFEIKTMKTIEVVKDGKKITTNNGEIKTKVKGTLVRDYQSKFERTAFVKFSRSVYEKWVIRSRVEQFEEKIFVDCDEFLSQAKAWLDLEGKR